MLTYIKNEHLDTYLSDTELNNFQFSNELVLLTKGNVSIFPKLFAKNYTHPLLITKSNSDFVSKTIDIEFVGELKEAQKPVMEFMINRYNINKRIYGILEGRTGFGKTVCTGYMISQFKLKTAIIVNTKKLQSQWLESLLKFTTLKETDISVIDSQVNSRKSQQHLYDCDVVILTVGFLGSAVQKDFNNIYNKISSAGFGFVVYDEVDNTSNTINYGSSTLLFDTHNILGLTATPFSNGLHKIILENTIGPTIYSAKDYDFKPIINIVKYNSRIGELSEIQQKVMWCSTDSSSNILYLKATYNSHLRESESHLKLVMYLAIQAVRDGYKPMIIITTKKQADQFKKLFDLLIDNPVIACVLYRNNETLDDNWNIICGVYKFCGRSYDNTEISTIIIASPYTGKSSLIQILGRSLRANKAPKIYLLSDSSVSILFNINTITNTLSAYYEIPKSSINIIDHADMENNELYSQAAKVVTKSLVVIEEKKQKKLKRELDLLDI